MSDTTPQASGDAGEPDFQAKYNGLNRVLQEKEAELQRLRAETAGYQAQQAAERQAEAERAEYERLKAEYDPNPTPRKASAARDLEDERRQRSGESDEGFITNSGYPT